MKLNITHRHERGDKTIALLATILTPSTVSTIFKSADSIKKADKIKMLVTLAMVVLGQERRSIMSHRYPSSGVACGAINTSLEMWLEDKLSCIVAWGNTWQVKFAPQKTQLLLLSRSRSAMRINFNRATLSPQELTFRTHIKCLARAASRKLTSL
ncbi:hypothetical protein E2C01_029584 [Portunus trituberculatus]|uniref:Uncharacterized protein n=1 Tax=Portunus trituberculatus TaxID=210409 RepID=A0A5B7ESC4_PORTR|nr:hypothetical protein [Portunus trituberculatus]